MAILENCQLKMSAYPSARIFYDNDSDIETDIPDYIGTHMIRDPRDVVVSGYFYHQWTKEVGYSMYDEKLGTTYQERVNTLPKEEGMMFEMQNKGVETMNKMRRWSYINPLFLEIRYEDLIADPDAVFTKMFQHWGVTPENLTECLNISRDNHMTQMTGRKVGEEQAGSHMRNGLPGQWKQHFSEVHKTYFKEHFGDILIHLGYEKSNDW